MNTYLIEIVKFLHDLFTAVWVGGLLLMTLTLLPALKLTFGHSAESEKVMDAVMRKQGKWVIISIIGLVATGILLTRSSGQTTGLMRFNSLFATLLSIKHLLMGAMVVIALTRFIRYRKLETQPSMLRKKTSILLLYINAFLGVTVLLLSALTASV